MAKAQKLVGRTLERANMEHYSWLVPVAMPKQHVLISHVTQFVRSYGFWGIFSEESFGYFLSVSRFTRQRHSRNKSLVAQIVDDLCYSWLLLSPLVKQQIDNSDKRSELH